MFRYIAETFSFVEDNIKQVIKSADDVIMFRCIAILCLCANKNDRNSLCCWRQYKSNILKLHLQSLQMLFFLGPY